MESILDLDANNLYGHSMSQYLPYAKFKWNKDEWTTEKILDVKADAKIGYLFEVTLKYPVKSKLPYINYSLENIQEEINLHDYHNGYALAPEQKSIKKE